jgi:DNA-binding transcriptional regulator YhcF (GntR family)
VALKRRIVRGDLVPGTRLSSHRELAVEFGVAPLTIRQVLGQLEAEGLVSREIGRGTFVRAPTRPAVLVVGDTAALGPFLADYIARSGHRAMTARSPDDALAALTSDPAIALVVTDIRIPTVAEGTAFIRDVRQRWRRRPVAVVITELGDLAGLFGAADWPLLVIPHPIVLGLLDEVLGLVLGPPPEPSS